MRVDVFAVEDHAAQVCFAGARPGLVTFAAGPAERTVATDGSPAAIDLDGLPADSHLELTVVEEHAPRRMIGHFRTLPPPPGALLSRFATMNDLHLGAQSFGTLRPFWEDNGEDPHPLRCARDAAAEARAWGAELIVLKGDLTQQATPDEWRTVGSLVASIGPSVVIEGNHDTARKAVDGATILASFGVELHQRPWALDLAGVRIVVFPTAAWHVDEGTVDDDHLRAVAELVGAAPGAAVVAMHHYPQRFRWPTMYPDGIPGPAAGRLLDALAEANPATLVLTGHSHRHRSHHHGPLVVAEVGSTKDYPGSWAGYAVHEGGIRQVTRRVAAPESIRWTEQGRRVMGGIWGVWAAGVRSHRCFTHVWPPRPA
ncbi:MAG TPA: metallophosphoesterase [Acidimicrobiales bacterium]|nr:metallophosphoesterase [Acidimicrobiales bacterium]